MNRHILVSTECRRSCILVGVGSFTATWGLKARLVGDVQAEGDVSGSLVDYTVGTFLGDTVGAKVLVARWEIWSAGSDFSHYLKPFKRTISWLSTAYGYMHQSKVGDEDGVLVGVFVVGFVGAGVLSWLQSSASSRQKLHTEHPSGQKSTPHLILPSLISLCASGHWQPLKNSSHDLVRSMIL